MAKMWAIQNQNKSFRKCTRKKRLSHSTEENANSSQKSQKTGSSQEIEPEKVMFKKTKAGKAKAKRAKTLKTKAKDT